MKETKIIVKVFDSVEKIKNILARQGLCKIAQCVQIFFR